MPAGKAAAESRLGQAQEHSRSGLLGVGAFGAKTDGKLGPSLTSMSNFRKKGNKSNLGPSSTKNFLNLTKNSESALVDHRGPAHHGQGGKHNLLANAQSLLHMRKSHSNQKYSKSRYGK